MVRNPIRSRLVNYWSRIPCSPNGWSALIGQVLVKFKKMRRTRKAGCVFILFHLASLLIYSGVGLSSSDKDNYSSIFVYGGSFITFSSYVVLYCADAKNLTRSIFQQGEGESKGTYLAKVGLMGIVLPVFNFIGLIFMFVNVGQDVQTFSWGIAVFSLYLLGNALLFFSRGEDTESEEHELRENNPPADTPVSDSPPADTPVSDSPAADSPVDTLPVNNSPTATSPVDNASTADSPAANSPVDNSSVDNPPANNSPRPSIRIFP
ncbi:hypothetical protein BZL39_G06530 [Zygosaccharomyces parabailii]|nr:hypothetical protein BZL39_G00110 [Zygosaccharomyces parabailii]AQZ14635.1 hypothetical protein BZL39_G06530 [Zygosaccharomyces parabailii]